MFRSLVIIALTSIAPISAADTFQLRTGGKVQGMLLNADEAPRTTYRIRLESGGDITLDAREVKRVVTRTPQQQRYRETLKQMPADTAELHWKMAALCLEWSLQRERKFHLEQTIRLDPNHELARKALKYKRQQDGTWARLEEIKEAQGYVKQGGKWLTEREAELARAAQERKETKLKWQKDLRTWSRWLKDRRRRAKALDLISAINDPMAAEPLIKMFRSERSFAVSELIAEVLGRLNSAAATRELARAAMRGGNEQENELRLHCIRQLEKNNRHGIAPSFVSELQSKDNVRVRRAGYALGVLGDQAIVLPLIKALRTKHTTYVGGRGNGNINAGTGGLSVGRTKPKKVDEIRNNKEVLSALVKLTDNDFDYNQQRWLDWYLSQTTPPNLDLRRDP